MWQTLAEFYNSSEWRSFRAALIHDRANPADGVLYSQYSGKALVKAYDIVLHHIKPLTVANVNDYAISLNPENIQIVSQSEHNEIHARFGYCTQRKVYIVHGAPCSGKTTFVNANKGNSDLVVDMDNIWQCITGGSRYSKPSALKQNAFAVRDCLLDMVRTRAGKWERAWIIEGLPRKGERERKIGQLGAESIYIDTDKETCLMRLANDDSRAAVRSEWVKYIEDYFAAYQE